MGDIKHDSRVIIITHRESTIKIDINNSKCGSILSSSAAARLQPSRKWASIAVSVPRNSERPPSNRFVCARMCKWTNLSQADSSDGGGGSNAVRRGSVGIHKNSILFSFVTAKRRKAHAEMRVRWTRRKSSTGIAATIIGANCERCVRMAKFIVRNDVCSIFYSITRMIMLIA